VVATNAAGTAASYNVFQGILTGSSQVTFFGVPILPPASAGIQRIFRITNLRANAVGISQSQFGVLPVVASIAHNASFTLQNSSLTVGYVQNGFDTVGTKVSSAASFPICSAADITAKRAGSVTFKEGFGTAFKTRVIPLTNTTGAGQGTNIGTQNIPGGTYSNYQFNTESGLVLNVAAGVTAGLADYGTRLKAVFSNIPTGVTGVYVAAAGGTVPATVGGTATATYGVLVPSELSPEGATSLSAGLIGNVTTVDGTNTAVQIPVVGNTATAVWEILNSDPNSIDSISFPYYVAAPAGSVAAGTMSVTLSFAPDDSQGAFTTAAGSAASSTLPIPRFHNDGSAKTAATFTLCQTELLWPFVAAIPGTFDTGIAISNTSNDAGVFPTAVTPTTVQTGTCTLNFFGTDGAGAASAYSAYNFGGAAFDPSKGTGTQATTVSSIIGTSKTFVGYVIGLCNFQYAHGYAAISDPGLGHFLSSYLALVMSPGATLNRGTADAEDFRF